MDDETLYLSTRTYRRILVSEENRVLLNSMGMDNGAVDAALMGGTMYAVVPTDIPSVQAVVTEQTFPALFAAVPA